MTDVQNMNMDEIDKELLEIFIEESNDIMESIEDTVKNWTDAPTDATLLAEFKRPLHTLKGGARLAGIDSIGNLTHMIESLLIEVEANAVDGLSVVDLCHQGIDELIQMLDLAAEQKMPVLNAQLAASFNQYLSEEAVVEVATDTAASAQTAVDEEQESEEDYALEIKQEFVSQSLTDGTGLSIVRSVLLPLTTGRLLMPNAAVAEIIPYIKADELTQGPGWCVGTIEWRGERIPVVSYEAMTGEDIPKISKRSRIAVCNAISGMSGTKFFGIVCAQIPHLIRVHENNIREAEEQKPTPMTLQDVVVEEVTATIPKVDSIEDRLRKEVPLNSY